MASQLLRNLYMDDPVNSMENTEKAREFWHEAVRIFKDGGFNLRKFRSNDENLLHEFSDSQVQQLHKVLGIIVQDVGKRNGWDEEVTRICEGVSKRYERVLRRKPLRVNRWLGITPSQCKYTKLSLHVFCDASSRAYAAAAYIVLQTQMRHSSVALSWISKDGWVEFVANRVEEITVLVECGRGFQQMKTLRTPTRGGWTLLKRFTIPENLTEFWTKNAVLDDDYKSISNYTDNFLFVSKSGVKELREAVNMKQLRWYCYKKQQGSIFHVMTKNDSVGYGVLDYFLLSPDMRASACNSFIRLPDDNSTLSQNCAKWGNNGTQAEVNEWGYYSHSGDWRIYREVSRWTAEQKSFSLRPQTQYWCDDEADAVSTVSPGDTWEVYAR
ncbi:hypothetical protein ACROYT_G007192 [Oculina patagonica]